jgi:signal transduction histidine kinase
VAGTRSEGGDMSAKGEDRTGVPEWLLGGGEMGELMRSIDWAKTPIGPPEAWPAALRTMLGILLTSQHPMFIYWGRELVQFYNDAYRPILGSTKHPAAMGQLGRECWREVWDILEPMMDKAWAGQATYVKDGLLVLDRHGFLEECYFDYAYTPIRDETGKVAGIFVPCGETTRRVIGERRLKILGELSRATAAAKTPEQACQLATNVLSNARADVPFALVYLADDAKMRRMAAVGLGDDHPAASEDFWPLERARDAPLELALTDAPRAMPGGPWPESPKTALLVPLRQSGDGRTFGHFIAGISPRLALDDAYRSFLALVAGHVASAVQNAEAYAEERRRAEKLAEVDRAKTTFFSNVSHEFRTPLTLMLGPLEDALADPSRALRGDALEAVHRSGLRLLRLVNNLLDFARIEANRLTSSLEPTDLPMLTAGLAGSFQSLLESAGLELRVECPPMGRPVYVDRSQWEKIVLNLVSNAFKFTFEGEIAVRLEEADGEIRLSVSDTGTGIPSHELPKIFERFHRVEGARGRSFEGTGIGLALVHELAKQHGGSVRVDSTVGKGTTFLVTIPRRAEPSGDRPATSSDVIGARTASYALEAAHWGAGGSIAAAASGASLPPVARARVLVADDNADMREYLVRLLSPRWAVETAEDGQAALEACLRQPPDLVLSDVMMPRMDGVGLLGALRANPKTSTVPIVLLSARAGEEAIVGGFETGADDYLVKPFAARELLARVQTHLAMATLRRAWAKELERTNKELESFSYSVSHDLRAPLRAIDGFSRALLEEYGAKLDEQASHYLRRVRAATNRMAQLIDDLLNLSRISRMPVARERVKLSELAGKVLADLREREPERRVGVSVAPGLEAEADPRLLAVLFENLLGNAWKFTSRKSDAHIEVGYELLDQEKTFFVRDNGAGFDMAFASRLFAPFQRLHTDSEFPGTGIGLATVQRVVLRHGGRIWALGEKDQGATFYFTLGGN